MSTPWDHFRAALIVGHLAVITIAAVPTPAGELSEARRNDPEVLTAIEPWTGLVVRLGLADDRDGAVDWLFDRGSELVKARRTALGPLQRWLRFSGSSQSWRMFGAVPVEHGRLEVHGMLPGASDWVPLYIENTPHQWNALLLNQSRIRALRSNFASRSLRGRYNGFSRRIASQALEEHPELVMVRVQLRTVRIPPVARLRNQGGLTEGRTYWSVRVGR